MTEALINQDIAQVLILEDEPSQLQTLTEILQDEGFGVIGCPNAAEALATLEQDKVTVAIVDLCLPDISTLELLQALEPWSDRVSIIVNTAYGSYETAREAVNLGAFAYVEKAGDPEQLVRQVHRAIQERLKRYAEELEQAVAERTQDLEQANERLRESEEKYRSIFEIAACLITSVKEDGTIVDCNGRVEQVLGYTRDEVIGHSMAKIIHPDDLPKAQASLEQILTQGYSYNEEYRMVRKDGQCIDVCINSSALRDSQGRLARTVCLIDDVTERKRTEESLIDYQKQLKVLASDVTLTEERLRRSVATALHDQISQSLAMSKVKVGSLRATVQDQAVMETLGEIADDIGQALLETRSLTSHLSYPTLNVLGYEKAVEKWLSEEIERRYDIYTQFTDDGREKPLCEDVASVLFRGVRELLMNVIKHARATRIGVDILREGDSIFTTVRDNGVGCDPDTVMRHSDGFGLLSIQEALERLGGRLAIESPEHKGLRITMQAPICDERNNKTTNEGNDP